MEVRTAYCSACDQEVRVVARPELLGWPLSRVDDPRQLVCLEYGQRCTGDMCPVFEVPTGRMRENLESLRLATREED